MFAKQLLVACAICAVLCLVLGIFPGVAHAQDSDSARAIDKDRGTKKGIKDSLASGKEDPEDAGKGPSRTQMAVGVGSFIVMIIVVKWL